MTRRFALLFALLAAFTFATACESKSEDKKDDKKTEEGAGEGGEEGGGGGEWAELAVGDMGLKVDAPAGAEAAPGIVGGFDIKVDGVPKASLSEANEFKPADLAAAKAEVTGGMYIEAAVGAEATTANGWTLTWTNKGGMGTNYWVWSRHEINGKAVFCEMTASTEEQQADALKICSSVRP